MPTFRPLAALALAATLAAAPIAGPTPARADRPRPAAEAARGERAFPYPVHQKVLPNGLRAVVVPMPGSGIASVRTVIRTGSRDEYERGHTGFAHFFEHMMFRGTKRMSQEERDRVVTQLGAAMNAYTSYDQTVYQFDVAASDLERIMDLESDRFMNLSYGRDVFQTEAGAVYGEYRKNRASPFFQLYEALYQTAFVRHTYGHTPMGLEADIAAMPRRFDYSRRFFARYYRPDNAVLIVAGDVEPEPTFALVEKYWSPWKKGYVPPKIRREPEQRRERRVAIPYEGKTLPLVAFAYKSQPFDPASLEWGSSEVLAELVFGEASPLHRRLVLEERIVQDLRAMPARNRDPGLFVVLAVVSDPTKVDAVVAALEGAIAEARQRPAEAARVAAAVSHLRYRSLLGLSAPRQVAEELADMAALTGDVAGVEALHATLGAVTPDTVQRAAERLFDDRRRTVAILREKSR